MGGLLRSIASMSAATALSRLSGFARTVAQTAALGTGAVAGAYNLSNTLPNQVYELFMGGLLSSIFIPILVERLARNGEEDARRFVGALLTVILPFLIAVAALGIVFAEPLISLVSGWDSSQLPPSEVGERLSLATLLFRVFALQIVFYGVGALAIGILNSHRRFFLPTFAPVLNNLVAILSFVAYMVLSGGSPRTAIYVLAAGTTLGVAVMALALLPPVWRLGYRPRFRVGHPALWSSLRLAGPMLLFVASSVGVQVAAIRFASGFDGNDEAWYAFTVVQLPYGVFIVAIATALVPELSERFAGGDESGYRATLSFGLRTTAFVAVPAAVGLGALAQPITGFIFERGAFGPEATATVSTLLSAYAAGLLGYGAYFVLVRSFYSRQNTRTPAFLNVGLFALYVGFAFVLSEMVGLVGVALAFSLAYTALALALLAAMRREITSLDGRRMAVSFGKVLLAGAVMYVVARAGLHFTGPGSGALGRAAVLTAVGGAALAAYFGAAVLLRTEELKSALTLLRRRGVPDEKSL